MPEDPEPEAPPARPEVGSFYTPSHGGGLLRYGNPGNQGGGVKPASVRRMIGEIVEQCGIPFFHELMSGQMRDLVAVKVAGGERVELVNGKPFKVKNADTVEVVAVPVRAGVRVQGLAVGLSSSSGMVQAEKAGLQKRRRMEIHVVVDSTAARVGE